MAQPMTQAQRDALIARLDALEQQRAALTGQGAQFERMPIPDQPGIYTNPETGERFRVTSQRNVEVLSNTRGPVALSPEQRGRGAITFAGAVDAEANLARILSSTPYDKDPTTARPLPDGEIRNPFTDDWGASLVNVFTNNDNAPLAVSGVAKRIGGGDYTAAAQARNAAMQAIVPILSGAQVTVSEGQQFAMANLPTYGDTPEVIRQKARNRMMMLNAVALLLGQNPPFAELATPDESLAAFASQFPRAWAEMTSSGRGYAEASQMPADGNATGSAPSTPSGRQVVVIPWGQ